MFLKILSPICDFYSVYQYKNHPNQIENERRLKKCFSRIIDIEECGRKNLKLKLINTAPIDLICQMKLSRNANRRKKKLRVSRCIFFFFFWSQPPDVCLKLSEKDFFFFFFFIKKSKFRVLKKKKLILFILSDIK